MKLRIITLLLFILPLFATSQNTSRVIKRNDIKFNIALLDTNYSVPVKLSFTFYSDTNRLTMKADSFALDTLYGPFMMEDFRTVLNDFIINKKKIDKPIRNSSLIEIYYSIIDTILGLNTTPLAGVLHLNNAVKVLTTADGNYTDRNRQRDSLESVVVPLQVKTNAAQKILDSCKNVWFAKNYFIGKYGDTLKTADIATTSSLSGISIIPKPDPAAPKKAALNVDSLHNILNTYCLKITSTLLPGQSAFINDLYSLNKKYLIKNNGEEIILTKHQNYPLEKANYNTWTITPRLDTTSINQALQSLADYNTYCDTLNDHFEVWWNGMPISRSRLKGKSDPYIFGDSVSIRPRISVSQSIVYNISVNENSVLSAESNTANAEKAILAKGQSLLHAKKAALNTLGAYRVFIDNDSMPINFSRESFKITAQVIQNCQGCPAFKNFKYALRTDNADSKPAFILAINQAINKLPVTANKKVYPGTDVEELESTLQNWQQNYTVTLGGHNINPATDFLDCSKTNSLGFTTISHEKKPEVDTTRLKGDLAKLLTIQDSLSSAYKKALDGYKNLGLYIIKDVQFQFESGFLERVQITITYKNNDQIFENIYPIGFSSPNNYRNLCETKLYVRNSNDKTQNAPHIYLGDVLQNYDNELNNYTRDYSPADTAFHVDPVKNMQVSLYKENLINLFETRAFTDLDGIGNSNPNGLIQLQISRNINLITVRHHLGQRSDWGVLNYLHLEVNASKIENKARRLILTNQGIVNDNQVVSPSYATNLDFRRYENFSAVVESNIFVFDFPDAKTTVHTDFGFRYGYTPVTDSIRTIDTATQTVKTPVNANNLDASTITIYPKIWIQFFSERRFGFTIGYQFNATWLFSNNQFKQIVSYSNKAGDIQTNSIDPAARYSHVIELTTRVEPNKKDRNGNLFLIARFFMQQHDVNTFFPQIQVGYAYNLLFKK